jgi:hypothetical protein
MNPFNAGSGLALASHPLAVVARRSPRSERSAMHLPIRGAALLSATLLGWLAFADDAKKPAAAPQAPKPEAALTAAFQPDVGTWSCSGKMNMGDKELPTKSQFIMRSELGGFLYAGEFEVAKSAEMPQGMKGHIHWAWDPASKKLVEFGVDSFGNVFRGTSEGFQGDTAVWNEEGTYEGKPVKSRTTVKRNGAKEMTVTSEIDKDGTWAKMGEDHCKKK